MSKFDLEYANLCNKIKTEGVYCKNRTGINTYSISPHIMKINLQEEFPILTIKKVAFKSAINEILWIYQEKSNNVARLRERGSKIWNEWEIEEDGTYRGKDFGEEWAGTIGTAYGWIVDKYDMVNELINKIRTNPDDRRMIMSLWQNEYLETASLPSCVWSTTWRVLDGKLNVIVNQRSCDVALGLPFNVSQYAVLANIIAQITGYKPGMMTWVISDAHIYENHIEGIDIQLSRINDAHPAPKLWINPDIREFDQISTSKELPDIKLIDYKHHAPVKMEVAI
ncbi:MAG: thymidylate synthase [Clostridia bacterium]|nr:thymidylate synthase [Clostridia bacterium]